MSKPTPENLHKKELKRKEEHKLQKSMSPVEWDKRKLEIRKKVLKEEFEAKGTRRLI
jgi:hypothetical protein